MHLLSTFLFPQPHRHHLARTAFHLPAERVVGFQAAGQDHSVAFIGIPVHIHRLAHLAVSQINRFHGRPDWASHVLLGNAVSGQHFLLAFRGRSAMAAHGRHNKGFRSPALHESHY